jgi:Carboxypeptidase regulatory-like domain
MSRLTLAVFTLVALTFQMVGAQAPGPAAQAPARAESPSKLPVRRVILYKNGIGYFEHLGKVRGSETVTIDFNSSQLNDVLKTLTAIDLGSGRVTGVSYNSEAPLEQRLGSLRLPIGQHATLAQLLDALRGARLEVHSGERIVAGRLLGVETRTRGRGEAATTTDELTLIADNGDMRTVEITPAVTVRLAERDSAEQVGTYLGLLASTRAQDRRRMSIATSGSGERDLLVSYVSEVPVWKTTYRIVLPTRAGAKPMLQGWAIVDNTIGEDWQNIQLSLVAGAPQSFIQQLSQPLYVQRPVVPLPTGLLVAPQTHQATLQPGVGELDGKVVDSSGSDLPGVTVKALDASGRVVAQAVTDADGAYSLDDVPSGRYTVTFELAGFRTGRTGVAIEPGTQARQNYTLDVGSVTESVTVTGASELRRATVGGRVGGIAGGAYLPAAVPREAIEGKLAELEPAAQGRDLGDLFEYQVTEPISIARNHSALVPILRSEVGADRVSLWNGRTRGGRALRSLWLTNSSGLTLDGGSFTVLDSGTFAGEGLIEPVKPGEKRLLSYAVDLGVQVEPRNGDQQRTVTRISIAHGLLVQHTEVVGRRVYTIRNSDTTERRVVIEHPIRAGWKLTGGGRPEETSADAYRFVVTVPAATTETLTVTEQQPLDSTYRVSDITDPQIEVIVRESGNDGSLKQALAPIVASKAALAALASDLNARAAELKRIGDDQQRVRENMKALKGTSEEQQLLKRYAAQLNQQEDRVETLRRETEDLQRRQREAQAELTRAIEALALDVAVRGRT